MPGAGSQGIDYYVNVYLPGNWTTAGTATGDYQFNGVGAGFSTPTFTYDPSTQITTVSTLTTNYSSGENVNLSFTLFGAPVLGDADPGRGDDRVCSSTREGGRGRPGLTTGQSEGRAFGGDPFRLAGFPQRGRAKNERAWTRAVPATGRVYCFCVAGPGLVSTTGAPAAPEVGAWPAGPPAAAPTFSAPGATGAAAFGSRLGSGLGIA
jgi:hypothetical protein